VRCKKRFIFFYARHFYRHSEINLAKAIAVFVCESILTDKTYDG